MGQDKQARKYQLTINNPTDKSLDHDAIKVALSNLKSLVYWCMADEIGLETQTPHTHIFIAAKTPIRFSTIKKRFPEAHIEQVHGSSQENKAYVEKSEKWADDAKSDTSVPGTFEEWGELPDEPGPGFRTDMAQLYTMIAEGYTDAEILRENPSFAIHIQKMDKIRQTIVEDEYSDKLRLNLKVIYVQGAPGVGKSKDIIERHGIERLYRVLDYEASGKWDFYKPILHDVVVLEEFRSNFSLSFLLNLADVYPLRLSARYTDKIATFHFLYIVSNWSLEQQYKAVQLESPDTWNAFLRRISEIYVYTAVASIQKYTVKEYFQSLNAPKKLPDWVTQDVSDESLF